MTRKFRYTEKVIRQSLKDDVNFCKKALLALWQYNPDYNSEYTEEVIDELDGFRTEYRLNEKDFLSSLARQLTEKGFLTDNQLRSIKNRIPKYAPILTELANKENKLRPIETPDSTEILKEGQKLFWFETQGGSDGPFEHPAIFYAKSGNALKARIPTNDIEARSLWLPRKSTMVCETKDKTYVGIPRWLCDKNKIPTDISIHPDTIPGLDIIVNGGGDGGETNE